MPRTAPSARREHPGPPASSADIQPQELVVTFLGAFARDESRLLWSGGLVALLGHFGFSPAAARIALGRLVDRGILERRKQGRLVSYVITPRTRELIDVGDWRLAEYALQPEWDGRWSLVWYSIPDHLRRQRHRLSRRLRFLGFGPLEDSTWVAPGDKSLNVISYLERLGLDEMAAMLVGPLVTERDAVVLVERAWDAPSAEVRYREFVSEFAAYQKRKRLSDKEAFVISARLFNTYRRFPYIDPGLPVALFSAARHRGAVIELATTLSEALAPAAQRYFDTTACPELPQSAAAVAP